MVLEIIGGAFGRTGTHSLAKALDLLGIAPCYHMHAFRRHPEHLPTWQAALDGKPVDWQALFADYQAALEWPAVAFLPQLLEAFPTARVILTHRDPESWYESAAATIFRALPLSTRNPNPKNQASGAFTRRLILTETFNDRYDDREAAIRIYEQHLQQVREMVPPERLLVFDLAEGWGPLCAFLGRSQPEGTPFPFKNTRTEFLDQAPDWFKKASQQQGG